MRKFDVKFKEKVVREYLAGKGGYKLLAAKFGIAESMVRRWVAAYRHHGTAGLIRQRGAYTIEFKSAIRTASRCGNNRKNGESSVR